MRVELIQYTPEPEKVVAAAARLCYSADSVSELCERLDDEKVAGFVRRLREMGHLSTFEHVSFQFSIDGVSRALSHQLVRHRIASYSQRSQRYVEEKGFDFVIPPSVKGNPAALKQFEQVMTRLQENYRELLNCVPAEDARYVLPNACTTSVMATFNARSLLNFFEHRTCQRAQWEIRFLANRMLELVRNVAPNLFSEAGPTCITQGVCRQGTYSCGRLKTLEGKK
ncbi:thymidylate synthase, flavin-dependent [Desulfosporosinus orientis DSM 765]|uniref:Flavin-dependent thymidylate synthase n=1 Tax=Desulfosporosinus orientis (strain ATCC 19365 / DSM 765 / NCIMB 8382 / VKM B-1628 / Singapore I) TaxID=768706 RepID=G7W7M6_DESOD|nr:FAD-dependent thymidylate synthase [Desulfosporosinus orientis]AET65945.1 thymidylate synthase, flavin-dependent [Desulfosporosinus orientis DSM 765]